MFVLSLVYKRSLLPCFVSISQILFVSSFILGDESSLLMLSELLEKQQHRSIYALQECKEW